VLEPGHIDHLAEALRDIVPATKEGTVDESI